jgi:hypothetical protein
MSPASLPAPRVRDGARAGIDSTPRHLRRLALGWAAPERLDRAGWLAAGVSLAEFGRVNNWWVGDWIRYGNAQWGEKYTEAARITGLDVKTLRNIAYVASRFDVSRRRDNLTWTHHAELAALSPERQEEWLERSLALNLSPGDLRLELRSAQRAIRATSGNDDAAAESEGAEDNFTCPHCGAPIRVRATQRLLAQPLTPHAASAGAR